MRIVAGALAASLVAMAAAQGTAYPVKPIRLVVPFPPGAGTDTVARFIAQKLGDTMKATDRRRQPDRRRRRDRRGGGRQGRSGRLHAAVRRRAVHDGGGGVEESDYDPVRQFVPVAPIAAARSRSS